MTHEKMTITVWRKTRMLAIGVAKIFRPFLLRQVILLICEREGCTFRRLPWQLRPIHQP
jgi:hypothetical protein